MDGSQKRLNKLPSFDEIPVGGIHPGIDCSGCASSCCHDVALSLTAVEAENLREAGTDLCEMPEKVGPLERIRRALGEATVLYRMNGDCGHLKRDAAGVSWCDVHGTDLQPQVCKDFPAGCVACIGMQLRDRQSNREP